MTPAQLSKLIDIGQELSHVDIKGHPSDSFRESFASYTQADVNAAVEALRCIYRDDDGFRAFMVIKEYKALKGGLPGVVGLHREGQI